MLFDIFITLFNNRLLWFRIIFILLNEKFLALQILKLFFKIFLTSYTINI